MTKALFLDRDGIINVDHGYVCDIEEFEFTKGIFELLQLFTQEGYLLFIVTNQSGIGRGYYSQEAFEVLTEWMINTLHDNGIEIQEVQYCPHAPKEKCYCRKPQTGMIDEILKKYTIDLKHSWMIGDKQSDIDLTRNAHIGSSIAIGDRQFQNYDYSFASIQACTEYLQKNIALLSK
ncbi:MAG: D-glycero-beta-D-manno-heptose-1,7-bisphosphate 7-phosphatase [Sulfurovum sp.]|nr:MAG: D-glycero-beta-D-manno-heptose-1,7-bisphosphate 7-phosphatase [Sulfurovum sp.]